MDCLYPNIDSNVVGWRVTEEECPGILPAGTPTWTVLPPNSFSDYGAQYSRIAHAPIRDDRQREKGTTSDSDVSGGANLDFTNSNLRSLMQGFMFADIRTKVSYFTTGAAGDLSIVVTPGGFPVMESDILDFTTLGLIPGEWIYIGGDDAAQQFSAIENNGFKRIRSITANAITFDKSVAPMVATDGAGKTVRMYFGQVLKNEQRSLIKRRTYAFERTLGSIDGEDPPQSEYLFGMTPNEFTLNIAQGDKLNADISFVGMEAKHRTQAEGLLPGVRPEAESVDILNTSTDFKRIKLSAMSDTSEAPLPLVAYFTEGSLTINNNASQIKVIGKIGGIGASLGNFDVGGSLTGLFSTIDSVKAVAENWDITLDAIMVKGSKATIFDVPLLGLGDGRPNVEMDNPITIPFEMEAGTAKRLGPGFNYTLMWVFFDGLPELAKTVA